MRSPLLLVYDAENSRFRNWVDGVCRRDRDGLIVSFPIQNPELVKVAPELAGRSMRTDIHGLDIRTRQIWTGSPLLIQVWARIPGWKWVNFLIRIPFISRLLPILKP